MPIAIEAVIVEVYDQGGAAELAAAGVARVVMGSAALADPSLVAAASEIVPVAVGLDHRGGELADRSHLIDAGGGSASVMTGSHIDTVPGAGHLGGFLQ